MSDDISRGIEHILLAQNKIQSPKVSRLSVLPPIGSSGKLPDKTEMDPSPEPSSSLPNTNIPEKPADLPNSNIPQISLEDDFDRMSLIARATPLIHRGSIAPLNLSDIPNNELMSPSSTARDTIYTGDTSDRTDNQHLFVTDEREPNVRFEPTQPTITVVQLELAEIPDELPDISGLQTVVDNLSDSRLNKIVDACRLYDKEARGYLSEPSILKCIGEVVPSARQSASPWRHLLDTLAPNGEFIEYAKLAQLIEETKNKMNSHANTIIPELLSKKSGNSLFAELPVRPTTSQADRELGRVQVMTEIEVLLMQNPEIDLNRLKLATTQNVIDSNEMMLILEMYGLIDHFRPFLQRLISSFLTHDNRFHFGAFAGCLENIKPLQIRNSAPPAMQTAPWMSAPLAVRSILKKCCS